MMAERGLQTDKCRRAGRRSQRVFSSGGLAQTVVEPVLDRAQGRLVVHAQVGAFGEVLP
jgi:hypothetical protein